MTVFAIDFTENQSMSCFKKSNLATEQVTTETLYHYCSSVLCSMIFRNSQIKPRPSLWPSSSNLWARVYNPAAKTTLSSQISLLFCHLIVALYSEGETLTCCFTLKQNKKSNSLGQHLPASVCAQSYSRAVVPLWQIPVHGPAGLNPAVLPDTSPHCCTIAACL